MSRRKKTSQEVQRLPKKPHIHVSDYAKALMFLSALLFGDVVMFSTAPYPYNEDLTKISIIYSIPYFKKTQFFISLIFGGLFGLVFLLLIMELRKPSREKF